jgi:ParB family transcriptional regulator, chromosome partitioning protein
VSLGKGLGAMFPDLLEEIGDKPSYMMCGIEELSPTRFQSRKVFDPQELKSLVASIRETGIIQPIVVRKTEEGFEIIAGERRWRAAQEVGLKTVPVVIREAKDVEVAEISLIENIQRAELNPIEEAGAYETLSGLFDMSQEAIATRVGKDRSTIANTMRLLKLPDEIRKALAQNALSAGHARALLSLSTKEEQLTVFRQVLKKALNVRETEALIKNLKKSKRPESKKDNAENPQRYLVDLEGRLSKRLMTKVRILPAKKGGVIEIRYLSNDDLGRLIDIMDWDDTL